MKKSMFVGLSMALLSLVSCTRSQEFDAPVAGMTLIARTARQNAWVRQCKVNSTRLNTAFRCSHWVMCFPSKKWPILCRA